MAKAWANGRTIAALRDRILVEYGDTCPWCGQPGGDTIEHLTARADGGTDDLDNLRLAHGSCNSRRGRRAGQVVTQPARWSRDW